MGTEIERKFLVQNDQWPRDEGTLYRQGYLSTVKERTVRVRLAGDQAFLTVKGISRGATRSEFEYSIPVDDALIMLDTLCQRPLIEKRRYKIDANGLTWEVDEFLGENKGLVLAEVELEDEQQTVEKPSWVGPEVTDDPKYFNANLVQCPYRKW